MFWNKANKLKSDLTNQYLDYIILLKEQLARYQELAEVQKELIKTQEDQIKDLKKVVNLKLVDLPQVLNNDNKKTQNERPY